MSDFPVRMNTTEAIQYLEQMYGIRTKRGTLNKLACVGGGPTFQKLTNKRLYTADALDDWAGEKLSPPVSSTSELRAM